VRLANALNFALVSEFEGIRKEIEQNLLNSFSVAFDFNVFRFFILKVLDFKFKLDPFTLCLNFKNIVDFFKKRLEMKLMETQIQNVSFNFRVV